MGQKNRRSKRVKSYTMAQNFSSKTCAFPYKKRFFLKKISKKRKKLLKFVKKIRSIDFFGAYKAAKCFISIKLLNAGR